MNKKIKLSLFHEEKIIDFVKNNEILYNVRHAKFRDSEAKNRLWSKLANEMNVEVETIKKKWANMRDYFVRNQTKKSTGKPATATKRDESMMFLLDTCILKRTTVTNMPSTQLSTSNQAYVDVVAQTEIDLPELESTIQNDDGPRSELDMNEHTDGGSTSMTSVTDGRYRSVDSETPPRYTRNKRRAPPDDLPALIYDLISSRKPNPVDFLPPTSVPKDHLDHFFQSLASTMRTFPELSVAKLKLKMSQLVGEEEVSLAQQKQSTDQNILAIDASSSNVSPSKDANANSNIFQ